MRRRTAAGVPLVLLALSLAGGGCVTREAERIAERRVNALLPQYLGPADRYQTRVRDTASGLLRGRMRHVHVEGRRVRVSDDLTLDNLTLDLANVSVDTRAKRLKSIEAIAFTATLGEAGANRYLRARRADLPELSVRFRPGEATVRARPEFAGVSLPIPLVVRGTLTPRPGGAQLDFTPSGAQVSVVPIPGGVVRFAAERLNPLVDLGVLKLPVRVEAVEVREGTLFLRGTVDPADLLRAANASAVPP